MSALHRRFALAVAAAATLAAAGWVSGPREGEAVVDAVPGQPRTVAPQSVAPERAPPSAPEEAARRSFPQPGADPFAVRSWAPPAVRKPAAATAPPLPYAYFGRMFEDGKPRVFLQRGERTYTVAVGDIVDTQYRIEDIGPRAVVITYLPLGQRQVLHTGSDPQ